MKTAPRPPRRADERIHVLASAPFFAIHLLSLLAFALGSPGEGLLVALGLYYLRMLGVTIGYHRYFSHRSFKTSRAFQLFLAVWAQTSCQKGALWWAAHHRHHHRESDQEGDIHSPARRGLWWSHVGWILASRYEGTRAEAVRDLARHRELVWLDRHWWVPPAALGAGLWALGGPWLFVWGFCVSTVLLWHGTFTINSLSHVFGTRRYRTTDTSRNNALLAVLTCGEGWHNNHHYHQNTANQGWFWWEVDLSFYVLKVLSWAGLVRGLKLPSEAVRQAHLRYDEAERARLRAESAPRFSRAPGRQRALDSAPLRSG